jgi:arylsulfatase A-like enzyme
VISRRCTRPHDQSVRLVRDAALWLAVALVAVKAFYLGRAPHLGLGVGLEFVRSLAAISYADVLFATVLWTGARLVLMAVASPGFGWLLSTGFVAVASIAVFAAVVNVGVFSVLGGFLTYPLLQMVGSVRMVRSSVSAHMTPLVMAALAGVPIAYVMTVWLARRRAAFAAQNRVYGRSIALAAIAWIIGGHLAFGARWATRQDRRIAENAHWVLGSSWWQRGAAHSVRLSDQFTDADLADFEPIGVRPVAPRPDVRRASVRSRSRRVPPPPLNVVLVVLESVAARWTSLYGNRYETTPTLLAEAGRGVVFDNFYAHIGRSSNSLAAMLLSAYPKLGFRDMTDEYPDLPGTSIASLFHDRGYRTRFVTPSGLTWAGWDEFLEGRGFDDVSDERSLACGERISSWGVEDRCLFDEIIHWMDGDAQRPFFLMAWTQQTHHPYEPTPGVPMLPLARDPVIDGYGFDRYLNVLHETDRQMSRVFEAVRRAGRLNDTLILVTGDHGQAFGYPHESFMQGRTIYDEDVRVPLLLWLPRKYKAPARATTVGSHVDLAPTIAELAGLPAAPDWQGRSLFDSQRASRAYFYVAEDEFMLGVREERWKYILNVRDGTEELFDLTLDPGEQRNVGALHPEICVSLRRRLAAWTEANRLQYLPVKPDGSVRLRLRTPAS